MKGYIHVYTGNGKGKTTAALGLALRAVGAGKKVYFAQFVKGKIYSEIDAINRYIPEITVKQYGRGCFIVDEPTSEDIQAAKEGLEGSWGCYSFPGNTMWWCWMRQRLRFITSCFRLKNLLPFCRRSVKKRRSQSPDDMLPRS
jgi:hypothetical protein